MSLWIKGLFASSLAVFALGLTVYILKDSNSTISSNKINTNVDRNDQSKYEVMGFLPYWMLANHKYLRYENLSTIVYFGLHVDSDGSYKKLTEEGTSELGWLNWRRSADLKTVIKEAKKHKVRMAVAMVMQENEAIESFLNCPSCWNKLTDTTLREMRERGVENLNIDFEYGGIAPLATRDQFTQFVSRMTRAIHSEYPDGQVSVSTHANSAKRTRLHDIGALSPIVDRIFIMAYDFHQLTATQTGPTAPLSGAPDKYRYDLTTMVGDYLKFSPPEKLILGVPYYGHFWITQGDTLGSFRIPGNDYIGYSKVSYYSACANHLENTIETKRWDEEAQTPWFVYFDNPTQTYRQCHYDNVASLRAKYQLAKNSNFAGIGIWALGYDGDNEELWELLEEEF